MRERETRWRQKARKSGRKQIAVWVDVDTYRALQTLIQVHNLRNIGETTRLLVDNRQQAQEPLQAVQAEDANPALKTADKPHQDPPPPCWTDNRTPDNASAAPARAGDVGTGR